MCLPDPTILIEADGAAGQKSELKQLGWPVGEDPDAMPSSQCTKVLKCMSKWTCRIANVSKTFTELEVEDDASLKQLLGVSLNAFAKAAATPRLREAADEIKDNLDSVAKHIGAVNMEGILEGYKRESLD